MFKITLKLKSQFLCHFCASARNTIWFHDSNFHRGRSLWNLPFAGDALACNAQSPGGLMETSHAVCMKYTLNTFYVLQCMYVCMAFEYNVCIQRRRKRKRDCADASGGLAKQSSIRIAQSMLVAGNFPWPMTVSTFSPLWGWFFLHMLLQHLLLSFGFPIPHPSWWWIKWFRTSL